MSYKIESPLPVIEGGTGVRSTTPYAVICGGTATTTPLQSIASVGTSGQVLTSNGPGLLPTFETGVVGEVDTLTGNSGGPISPVTGNINVVGDTTTITIAGSGNTLTASLVGTGAIQTVTGDIGVIAPTSANINLIAGNSTQNAGSTVLFSGSGDTITFDVTDINNNTIISRNAGNATLSGAFNTALGTTSAHALTSGSSNVFIGAVAGAALTSGSFNTFLGLSAGQNYTSSESSNICIGYNTLGVVAESHVLRIGSATGTGNGQLNKAIISGIFGMTPSAGIPVFISSGGQLGTVGTGGATLVSSITGNSGGAVGPSSGNINIVGDGTTIDIVGNPGTNTLTVSTIGSSGITSITPDFGGPQTSSNIGLVANSTAGSSVSFTGATGTILFNVTDANFNTIIGMNSGFPSISGIDNIALGYNNAQFGGTGGSGSNNNNIMIGTNIGNFIFGAHNNVMIGSNAGSSITDGNNNVMIGYLAGTTSASDSSNIMIGASAGSTLNGGTLNVMVGINSGTTLATGDHNTFYGANSANLLATGTDNIIIGYNAGTAYTAAESSNILIGSTGTSGDANVLVIGAGTGTGTGQLNSAFISGIYGMTPASADGIPVFIGSNGQLGTIGNGGVNSVGTDSGTAVPAAGVLNITAGTASLICGSSVSFSGVTSVVELNVTDTGNNTIIGLNSGNSSVTSSGALDNTVMGFAAGGALNGGIENVIIGSNAGTGTSSGQNNTMVGFQSGRNLNGNFNTFFGDNSGAGYLSSESSNICIGYGVGGNPGDSNVLTIGRATGTGQGQLNQSFIFGINGITTPNVAIPVLIDSTTEQLGTISSSRKVKHSIEDMNDVSEKIMQLRPVKFVYNGDISEREQYGLIAEEVDEIFPGIVARNKDGEIQTVLYHVLPILLLNEMKKQNALIQNLMERIKVLEESK